MPPVPAIGIDLGTTYARVGVIRHGQIEIIANDHGNRSTPSCVAFSTRGRLVGDAALNQVAMNPAGTILNVKRLIGRRFDDASVQSDVKRWPFDVVREDAWAGVGVEHGGCRKTFLPEEISAMLLARMKETAEAGLGCEITDAVLSVPAHFDNSQRQATINAAVLAGLNVLRLISEPAAAAVAAFGSERALTARNVLVYDLGGGSFDVSILAVTDGAFKVVATEGDTHLGGEDFDNLLVDDFVNKLRHECGRNVSTDQRALRRLRTACERAKRMLSWSHEASIQIDSLCEDVDFSATLTRAHFEDLCEGLFQSTLRHVENVLLAVNMDKRSVHDIVLVGGSTRIPRIQQLVKEFFNGMELHKSIHRDEAVVSGATMLAAALSGGMEQRNLVVPEVAPISLGIEVMDGTVCPLIKRNTPIPAQKSKLFQTNLDFGSDVCIAVYEGQQMMANENVFLGRCRLDELSLTPGQAVTVTFSVDTNGIVGVSAVAEVGGKVVGVTMTSDKGRLAKHELERMLKAARAHSDDDCERKVQIAARNKLERYGLTLLKTLASEDCRTIPEDDRKALIERIGEILAWVEAKGRTSLKELDDHQKQLEQAVERLMIDIK